MTKPRSEPKVLDEGEVIRRVLAWKFAADAAGAFFPDRIVAVDAGGGHAISAVIVDSGVCLTVGVLTDSGPSRQFQFFTSESLRALRDACDRILARGPLIEDPDSQCDATSEGSK